MSFSEWYLFALETVYTLLPQGWLREVWTLTAELFGYLLAAVFAAGIIAGARCFPYHDSVKSVRFVLLVLLAAALAAMAAVMLLPLYHLSDSVVAIGFLAALVLTPLAVGLLAGLHIRHCPAVRWYLAGMTLLAVVLFLLNLGSIPSVPELSKENLKAAFRKHTGRDANEREKQWFWKGTTGNERPSKGEKNRFWDSKKDK